MYIIMYSYKNNYTLYIILIQDSNLDLDIRSILLYHWANKSIVNILTLLYYKSIHKQTTNLNFNN